MDPFAFHLKLANDSIVNAQLFIDRLRWANPEDNTRRVRCLLGARGWVKAGQTAVDFAADILKREAHHG